MKWFDFKKKNKDKEGRFQRPEFKEKLERARKYARIPKESAPSGLRLSAYTLAAAALLLTAAVYFLMISDLLLVDKVEVREGDISVQRAEETLLRLEKNRVFFIPENHILFLSRNRMLKALQAEAAEVKDVSYYQRVFPDTIILSAEVSTPSYVWKTGSEHFLLDQEGLIFQKIQTFDPTVYQEFLLIDRLARPVVVGENLRIDETLSFLETVRMTWLELIHETGISGAELPGRSSIDLFVNTAAGFQVIFSSIQSPDTQVVNLRLLLDREINPETLNGLAYIDLRLPEVAYYCYKDAPCAEREEQGP